MTGDRCSRHRETLAALAERQLPTPAGRAAIDHVERCPDCAAALGELMLTVVALRRLADDAARATLPGADDAWARLRARIEESGRRAREQAWRWRATLGGMATASLLVAAIVGPATIRVSADAAAGEPIGFSAVQAERLDWRTELGYVTTSRAKLSIDPLSGSSELSGGSVVRTMYPDGIRPERKEVQPGRATTRLPEAG